jgi:hypothetical protein
MSHNKFRQVFKDRARVVAGALYDANYFRSEHHLPRSDTEKIIKQTRRNRERANDMAVHLLLTINMRNTAVSSEFARAF